MRKNRIPSETIYIFCHPLIFFLCYFIYFFFSGNASLKFTRWGRRGGCEKDVWIKFLSVCQKVVEVKCGCWVLGLEFVSFCHLFGKGGKNLCKSARGELNKRFSVSIFHIWNSPTTLHHLMEKKKKPYSHLLSVNDWFLQGNPKAFYLLLKFTRA